MNSSLVTAILVGIAAGLIIGMRLAQRSEKEQPVLGGATARWLHLLACSAFAGGVPAGLLDIFLGRNFLQGILVAFGFIGVAFAALLVYGMLERQPRLRAEAEDKGWTPEKARSSGL